MVHDVGQETDQRGAQDSVDKNVVGVHAHVAEATLKPREGEAGRVLRGVGRLVMAEAREQGLPTATTKVS